MFVGLDRIGLGGGGWAGVSCILVGASVAVSVPVTLRLLAGDDVARVAVPFVVLFPGAVWVGASADGLFAGVTAAGIALLAYAVRRSGARADAGLGAGVLLGLACFLSYGLVLMAPIAAAVVLIGWRLAPAYGPTSPAWRCRRGRWLRRCCAGRRSGRCGGRGRGPGGGPQPLAAAAAVGRRRGGSGSPSRRSPRCSSTTWC